MAVSIPTRRHVVASGLAGALAIRVAPARATPAERDAAIKEFAGDAPITRGRIKLDCPPLVENGNTVPLLVEVESPMTDADHVRRIAVLNERNPQPHVVTVQLGPRSGRAVLSTRIRLANSQRVVAIAEMSDGTYWSESADVIVTLAACVEG